MKLPKALFSVSLAVALSFTILLAPVQAAAGHRYTVSSVATHNQSVEQKAAQLQQKYDITITYPTYEQSGQEVAAIFPETLDTLDTALGYVTPQLVKQVSAYYRDNYGRRLRIAYQYGDLNAVGNTLDGIVGSFYPDSSQINLYIPRRNVRAVNSGDNPMTIVHEFGHAFHVMVTDKYGYNKLESEWNSYNGSYYYASNNIEQNPRDTVFITAYGATSFDEDFAETFAHAFVCNRPGMGFSSKIGTKDSPTGLRRKVNSVYKMLNTYFPDCADAVTNFQKLYTASSSASYNGITVSGFQLLFMGYAEPRYMPAATLDMLEIGESSYKWHGAIGAWIAPGSDGKSIILFPSGNWASTAKQFN